jgi:hypothetical protein
MSDRDSYSDWLVGASNTGGPLFFRYSVRALRHGDAASFRKETFPSIAQVGREVNP